MDENKTKSFENVIVIATKNKKTRIDFLLDTYGLIGFLEGIKMISFFILFGIYWILQNPNGRGSVIVALIFGSALLPVAAIIIMGVNVILWPVVSYYFYTNLLPLYLLLPVEIVIAVVFQKQLLDIISKSKRLWKNINKQVKEKMDEHKRLFTWILFGLVCLILSYIFIFLN